MPRPRAACAAGEGSSGTEVVRLARCSVPVYRYLYDTDQLSEWVPKVQEVAKATREVHVVFNNCYGNYGTTNAVEMAGLLGGT